MPKGKPANDAERMERAEEYMAAAREHHVALGNLPDTPDHYPMAYYLAGLSVECLFRAYVELVGSQHDANHSLLNLAESGRFLDFMPEEEQDRLRADLGEIYTRWLNNHRYRAVKSLTKFLNSKRLYRLEGSRAIRGDADRVLKYNWEILQNASLNLLNIGIQRWKISKEKWNRL
jgi:hypothetical protein